MGYDMGMEQQGEHEKATLLCRSDWLKAPGTHKRARVPSSAGVGSFVGSFAFQISFLFSNVLWYIPRDMYVIDTILWVEYMY